MGDVQIKWRIDLKCSFFLSCKLRLVLPMKNSWQSQQIALKTSLTFEHLNTGEPAFAGKKRLNTMRVLENNSKFKATVEFVDASLYEGLNGVNR